MESIQVGPKAMEAREIQYALGLPSPAYSFEEAEGNIRCTVKGIGHGYGFDQYGAGLKAKEGWTAEKYWNFIIKILL